MKHLIMDGNHVAYRILFTNKEEILNEEYGKNFFKYLYLNLIFSSIEKFKPGRTTIAFDSRVSWRKKVYSEYKANRKEQREKDDIDWDSWYMMLDELKKELQEVFPFNVLQIKYAEADDIIAVLSYNLKDDIIIVSSDKDFKQLLVNEKVKLFDPIKDTYLGCDNPKRFLLMHILLGDSSDNIPNVKKRVGEKTLEKYLDPENDKYDFEEFKKENIENIRRNRRLIDLTKIPDKVVSKIIKTYQEEIKKEKTILKVGKYFLKLNSPKFIDKHSKITNLLKSLK